MLLNYVLKRSRSLREDLVFHQDYVPPHQRVRMKLYLNRWLLSRLVMRAEQFLWAYRLST